MRNAVGTWPAKANALAGPSRKIFCALSETNAMVPFCLKMATRQSRGFAGRVRGNRR
jgi:hypothetical protein